MTTQAKFGQVLAVVATLEAQYKARQARIEAAYSEANNGVPPTEDSKGRFHAPCDGYTISDRWADLCIGDYYGKLFARGEYLPVPCTDEDHYDNRQNKMDNMVQFSLKVKAIVSDVAELKSMRVHGVLIETGKSWVEECGPVAYAYISGIPTLVRACVADLESAYAAKRVKGHEVYLEGKHKVIGTLVATKVQYDPLYGPQYKMLVTTAEGFKLWGTLPRSLSDDDKGKQVTFSATFTKGKDGLSYYKRPTSAAVIGE